MVLINAAKMCIPRLWGTPRVASLANWYKRIDKIAEMEELYFNFTRLSFQKHLHGLVGYTSAQLMNICRKWAALIKSKSKVELAFLVPSNLKL